ncbi:MAG: hypothetical protein JWM27_4282 [Gemmatimonadetes bacterium]|nr:hypothetical protein [Gemmatimonadota bacterium]
MRTILVLPTLALVAACGSAEPKRDAAPESTSTTGAATSASPSAGQTASMPMQSSTGMEEMQAHLQAIRGASGDSMRAMLPAHRQMTANMLASMGREMREMDMKGDAAWDATADSLRQDLVRMPEMDSAELKGFMPAHQARLERLMEMHRRMSGGMKM